MVVEVTKKFHTLTPREREVLLLLKSAMSTNELASALTISPATVTNHLNSIYSKLGVRSRTEAAIYVLTMQNHAIKVER